MSVIQIRIGLAAALILPLIAFADQLVMKNGDVITGTVKKITDGKVTIDPPYSDAFAVSLSEVAKIDSEETFEVIMDSDADKVTGRIALDPGGEQLLIIADRPRPLDLALVSTAQPPQPDTEWSARADFNITSNSGNTESQNTLFFTEGQYRHGANRHHADLTFRRDDQDGVDIKNQDLLNYNYQRLFRETWFFGGSFTYERDPIRELDYRYVLGADLGRDLIDTPHQFLTVSGGIGYSDEEIAGIATDGLVALWRLRYEQKLWDGKVNFFHNHNITQQFYDLDNLIFKTNTGFRFDLTDTYYANFSFRYDYETEPAAGASKDDSTVVVGLGARF